MIYTFTRQYSKKEFQGLHFYLDFVFLFFSYSLKTYSFQQKGYYEYTLFVQLFVYILHRNRIHGSIHGFRDENLKPKFLNRIISTGISITYYFTPMCGQIIFNTPNSGLVAARSCGETAHRLCKTTTSEKIIQPETTRLNTNSKFVVTNGYELVTK